MKEICVLIVDDDREVLNTLSEILAELRLTPVTAFDGAEALKSINSRKVDLIITDLMMPKTSGMDLLKAAKV